MKHFLKNPKFMNAIGWLAVVLGIIRVPTLFLHLPILTYIGETFAMTGYPVPYNHPMTTDAADPDRGLSFTCEKVGYPEVRTQWSHYVRGNLSGPHRRTITFVNYFDFATRARAEDEEQDFEEMTRYYFCNNGPLALAGACPPLVDAVLISFTDPHYGATISESRVQCRH